MLGSFHPAATVLLRFRPAGGGRDSEAPGRLFQVLNGVLHIAITPPAVPTEAYVLGETGFVLLTWDGHRFGGDPELADLMEQTLAMLRRGANIDNTAPVVPRNPPESPRSTQNTTL